MVSRRIGLQLLAWGFAAGACAESGPAGPRDSGGDVVDGSAIDGAALDARAGDAGAPPAATMSAQIEGVDWTFTTFSAVSHTVGRTVEFTGAAEGGYPRVNGTLSFEMDGSLAPCGVENPDGEPSIMIVWPTTDGGLFGAPDGLTAESACTYELLARPRCPDDVVVLRFSAELRRGAETLSIQNGLLSAPVEFLLHGEPVPDGC